MVRRRLTPAIKAVLQKARSDKLEQRARLIGAGIILPKIERRNKFNQVKVIRQGETFDSMGEAEYANHLDLLKSSGKILDWKRPKTFILLDAPRACDRIKYTPDFEVWPMPSVSSVVYKGQSAGKSEFPLPQPYYIDFKGSRVNPKTGIRRTPTATQAFSLRVRLWRATVPFELRLVYSDGVEKVLVPAKVL